MWFFVGIQGKIKRLGVLVVAGALVLVTVVAVVLSFQNQGNVAQLRVYELGKSLGKSHLDRYIFKKQQVIVSEKIDTRDLANYKLDGIFFPLKADKSVKEINIELAIRYDRQKHSAKELKESEVIFRDLAIQYFIKQKNISLTDEFSMTKAKKDLLLSFNDVLNEPLEGVYLSNLKVRN